MPSKLVRDKIPGIIQNAGAEPITRIATEAEYAQKLNEKLQEEVNEFLASNSTEEIADILEVLYAIADLKKINKHTLEQIREKKREERGGFQKRIILDETR